MYYAEIVRDKAILRGLLTNTTKIQQDCYDETSVAVDVLEKAEQGIFKIAERGVATEAVCVKDVLTDVMANIEGYADNPGEIDGIETGFEDIDNMLHGLKGGQLIIVAGRTSMGKTSYILKIIEHATMEQGKAVCLFSMEMGKEQIIQNMLCIHNHIDSHRMESGVLTREQYVDLSKTCERFEKAEFYVDDMPHMTPLTLRAKARREKRRHGIDLLVVDYVQLMHSTRRKNDNRQQEVAEISRALKGVARELDIPVVAVAQLNRQTDAREGHRPRMSDLRECLATKNTFLSTLGGVCGNVESRISLHTLNKAGEIKMSNSTNVPKKSNDTIIVRLESGKAIQCTKNHEILTDRGWVKASKLTRDYAVATAHRIPAPQKTITIPHARWIGWMLGNGSMCGYASPSFICSDKILADAFIETTQDLFGLTPKYHRHWSSKVFQYDITAGPVRTAAGNPCKDWLKENDLWGRRSIEKVIPSWFLETADNKSVAELVGGLVDTDGCVPLFKSNHRAVKYSTSSLIMAHQFVWCLARLGIHGRLDEGWMNPKFNKHKNYNIAIGDGIELRKFREQVVLTGSKGQKLQGLKLCNKGSNTGNRLGLWAAKELVEYARQHGISQSKLGYRNQKKRISRHDLRHYLFMITANPPASLAWLVSEDIYWDRLKRIEDGGLVKVFDRQVPQTHNFIANGIIVHNSGALEQDADVVMLLYRPEYYKPEDEDLKNKAEMIIAKHRNGRTGTVELAFIKSQMRFATIARSGDKEERPRFY
jgi:replicative DNA helicase